MKNAIVAVLLCISTALVAQDISGAICVAPIPHEPPSTAGTPELICKSGSFSFRIDSQKPVAWPKDKSTSVTGLDLKGSHRIVVLRDGEPQQSFKFRPSEYKTGKACLFLNDLYWTAQLWEPKQAPWCKCNPIKHRVLCGKYRLYCDLQITAVIEYLPLRQYFYAFIS
jgi:hypothetical protein